MKTYQFQKKILLIQPDGTYKRKSIYGKSESELEFKINSAIRKSEKEYENAKYPKFKNIALVWNETHESEISHYTYSCYQSPLNDLVDEFGDKLIKDITSIELQRFINSLSKKGYAKHTLALRKIVASLIFDYAILQGVIYANPATVIKIPKNAPKKARELPKCEDIEIIKQSVNASFGLFAYLTLYTGCRRGEVLALNYEDIDLKNNLISINKVIVFENNKPIIYNRTKNGDTRTIPLLQQLKSVLPKKAHGIIFKSKDNKHLTLSEYNILWNRYKRETGINLSPHQLRHQFATICFDAGLEAKDAAQILGHKKIELTLDIYTHIEESRKKQSADKLNKFLSS